MAALKKRGHVWWIKFYSHGRHVEKSLGTGDLRKARRLVSLFEAQQEFGIRSVLAAVPAPAPASTPAPAPVPPPALPPVPVAEPEPAPPAPAPAEAPPISVKQALSEFHSHLLATRTRKSAESDRGRLAIFFEAVRVTHLQEVTPAAIQGFVNSLVREKGRAPKTANEYRGALRAMFNFALNCMGYRPPEPGRPNPASALRPFRVPAPEITFLTAEDIDRQLAALESHPRIQAVVATYIFAGLRRAEALWLTPEDVTLDGPLPRICVRAKTANGTFWQPKTKVNRAVPVSTRLLAILRTHAAKLEIGSPWFFPSPLGVRWDEDNFSAHLRVCQEKAGLKWGCLDFRHTFGTHLARKGVSLLKIARLMGNSPMICQRHYASVLPEELVEEVEFA